MTTKAKLLSEEESKALLASFWEDDVVSIDPITPTEDFLLRRTSSQAEVDYMIEKNNKLIDLCNDLLEERISNGDMTLKMSEIVSAKDTAFRQNQLLKNQATENININIKDIQGKNEDELLELLESLN